MCVYVCVCVCVCVCVFRQHFLIEVYLIIYYRQSLLAYFCFDFFNR